MTVNCKGSIVLGTACRKCEHCKKELARMAQLAPPQKPYVTFEGYESLDGYKNPVCIASAGGLTASLPCGKCERCKIMYQWDDAIEFALSYYDPPPRSPDLDLVFAAGRVRRWHGNILMSEVDDRNDAHQGRVARILAALHPSPSYALVMAGLTHDDGELRTGDLNGDVKRANPELREGVRKIENAAKFEIWGKTWTLTDEEQEWLKFADLLDSYMIMKLHKSQLERRLDWKQHKAKIVAFAERHKTLDRLQNILMNGFEFLDHKGESS